MNTCIDCKYFKNEDCTHPYKDDCENSSLWWPKDGEYIDRDKAIAYVEEQYRLFKNDENKQAIVEGCVESLKFVPTANVKEVKHGYWIEYSGDPDIITCSECDWGEGRANKDYKLCPMCGAKMDGGKAE